jgi:hypothetical protein
MTRTRFGLGFLVSLSTLLFAAGVAGAQDVPDVEGVWAQKLVTTGLSNAPIIGDVTSQTVSYQKFDIEQSGKNLEITETTCDVIINSEQNAIRTVIPDRFVESIKPVERRAELRKRDDGFYFFAPKTYKTFGVELDDKSAKLPETASDPRVIDQDKDNNPGMTVQVEGVLSGELHMIQRSWDEYWGKVLASGQIAGRTTWDTDQIVLEKTGRIFGEVSPAKPHPNAKLSYFRMVRVPEGTSCAEIAKKGEELF